MNLRESLFFQLAFGFMPGILTNCSQGSSFSLGLKKTSVGCFGTQCNGCSRVEGYIGISSSVRDSETRRRLEDYFSTEGEVKNIVPDTVFTGYVPTWNNLVLDSFVVKAANGNDYLREDGSSVKNLFSLRTITSLRLPNEDTPLAEFYRANLENKDIKLLFLLWGPSEVKTFDTTGVRTRIARVEEATLDNSLNLFCMDSTFRFDRKVGFNLELDGAFATGEISSPGRLTLQPFMTDPLNPNLPSLCGAQVWRDDNPLAPSGNNTLFDSKLLEKGLVPIPYGVFQTSDETRAKFFDFQDCPVDETNQ